MGNGEFRGVDAEVTLAAAVQDPKKLMPVWVYEHEHEPKSRLRGQCGPLRLRELPPTWGLLDFRYPENDSGTPNTRLPHWHVLERVDRPMQLTPRQEAALGEWKASRKLTPRDLLLFAGIALLSLSSAVACWAAVGPREDGYYIFLRWLVSATALWCASLAFESRIKPLAVAAVIYCAIAIIFNPVLPVPLGRPLWQMVDIVAGMWLLLIPLTIVAAALRQRH